MMTYLTPFERTGYDLFRSMRDWENEFFGEKSAAMSSCKTDIRTPVTATCWKQSCRDSRRTRSRSA